MRTGILVFVLMLLVMVLSISYYYSLQEQDDIKKFSKSAGEAIEFAVPASEEAEVKIIKEPAKEAEVITAIAKVIEIKDYRFTPEEVYIEEGTKVRWVNKEEHTPHKIVAFDRAFYSPRLEPGEAYEFTFNMAGDFQYFDGVFPKSGRGIIHVSEKKQPEGFVSLTGNAVSNYAAKRIKFASFAKGTLENKISFVFIGLAALTILCFLIIFAENK